MGTQKEMQQPEQCVASDRSLSFSCSVSSSPLDDNMAGEDSALLAPTSSGCLLGDSRIPSTSASSHDAAFSPRGATTGGLQRVKRCPRPSVAFLKGNVADAVSRLEAKMTRG